MNNILTILLSAVSVVITGLATWLTSYLVMLINKKIKDKDITKWMTQITEIVMNAVKTISQTYVNELKSKGKFDTEAQKIAFQKALGLCMSSLTEEAKTFIKNNYGDIEAWLRTQIESTIYSLKGTNK